jgi:Leucine-rich repeat (LRR) protein
MERLTDIEIYNCPNLTSLPMEMLTELPALQMLNIACNKGISAEQLKSDWEAFIDGKSGEKIQVIYMAYNNLKESPDESYMKRMKSLGMLDLAYNELERIHPMGKEINIAKIYLDYNKLTEIPHDSEGYFCGYANVESFSCSNNRLTKFPDIFNAKSVDVMASIDFSYNLISEFENGKDHRGINSASVNLSNNRLETFPSVLFHKNSPMNTLMLSGNGMKEIPKDALEGKNSFMLTSLDLSYNKLTKLNDNFLATHIPYLYGIDLSYNCFKDFPYEPLNISSLTTFGIRHQRDAEGNRILRTWPTGLYTCPSLTAFYIGGNDLRLIEDQISPYIRLFEIKDNPNITITLSSTVCDYIYAGYYTLIYDRTQDIRGCSYLDLD